MEVVRKHFRPEFLNRIDEIILFQPARPRADGRHRQDPAGRGSKSCWPTAGSRCRLDGGALHWLAERGYDPVYGARPLRRVIQKELMDLIAQKLLAGEIADGAVLDVHAGEDGLEIGKVLVN